MDSGNSGSFQSSSGGDEELDSRAEAMHPLLHRSATAKHQFSCVNLDTSLPNNLPPSPPPPPPTSIFDNLSYFDAFPRSPLPNLNPLPSIDHVWGHDVRSSLSSETNCTKITGFNSPSLQAMAARQTPVQQLEPPAPPRSSKKRSRASRRAPTTVLNTDTTNFRAMVQEFTGIPSPPFAAAASPFSRSRLDLFHTAASSSRPSIVPDSSAPPPYLLRPSPHKALGQNLGPLISSTSSSSSSSVIDAFVSSTSNTSNANANTSIALSAASCNTNPTSTTNYQLLSQTSLQGLQNPIFSFQSLLQSSINSRYSLPTMPAFSSKSQAASTMASTSEFSVQLGELQSLVGIGSSHQAWAGGEGSQRESSCKLNYSTSVSPDLHAEKGNESSSARGEGIVDSWICSSD